jgi:hypothetical protein
MSGKGNDAIDSTPAPAASTSNSEAQGGAASAAASSAAGAKGPEKTISCVSCRRRKLKCDRVKPKCGTCIRLRHECEYPERRRNLGSRRRNMKELEERLGTSIWLRSKGVYGITLSSSGRDKTRCRKNCRHHSVRFWSKP